MVAQASCLCYRQAMGRGWMNLCRVSTAIVTALSTSIMLLLCHIACSDIRLSGSAYNESSLVNGDETVLYGSRSDLHLKAVSRSEGAKLVAELDFYTLHGYLAGTDEAASNLLRDGQFYVDRLYLKFPISKADLTLGKQRIAWGSGNIFRPTDTFNRPNPLGLTGRKEGVNALLVKVSTDDLSAVEFVIAPPNLFRELDGEINLGHLKYGKFASRFSFSKFSADTALSYQYDGADKNHIIGLDIKGDLKLGYHLETVFIYNRDSFGFDEIEESWQSVLGVDYSFAGKWILLGEYLYNGRGRSEKFHIQESDFALLDQFQYRHYLYSQVSYLHDILLSSGIFVLWSMVEGSFIVSPSIQYSLFQNMALDLYSQIFFGDETDEYGPEHLGVDRFII